MYLKYGSYQHAAGEVSVVISKQGVFTDTGISRGIRERWDIQGRLQAADQSALTAAINAIQNAYALQSQDVGFYFDDSSPTSHAIRSAATNGGVRVVTPPSFPQGRGAEYSTFRNYSIALEAEWLDPGASLLSWTESLSFQGGGPVFGFLEPIAGLPQRQLLRQATVFRATQTGQAIGYSAYPLPAAPLWPDAEHTERRDIRYELPQRMGPPNAAAYTQFKVSWSYSFEDSGPLVGLPTPWPNA
ncbi:MAG TPA: hypothetical protein VHV08_06300 [Pirellulales bacterium]|jgi:hypothetical protein|nr:hypothetical protein [Pirellulales bacterium]